MRQRSWTAVGGIVVEELTVIMGTNVGTLQENVRASVDYLPNLPTAQPRRMELMRGFRSIRLF